MRGRPLFNTVANIIIWLVIIGLPIMIVVRVYAHIKLAPERAAAEAAYSAWYWGLSQEQRNHVDLMKAIEHQTDVIETGNAVAAAQAETVRRQLNAQLQQEGYQGPWNF